nr:cysteine-rich CWC family protein [uncultured Roseateles sp.]
MSAPELADTADSCPRCGAGFHCGAQDTRCDCFDLQLSAALRQRLSEQYSRCLCLSCLRELSRAEAGQSARPG